MSDVIAYLKKAVTVGASDILIISGMPVSLRCNGVILAEDEDNVMPDTANALVEMLYELAGRGGEKFSETGDDDFPLSVPGLSRFRVSAYRQRGSSAAVVQAVARTKATVRVTRKQSARAVTRIPAGAGRR